MIEFKPRKIVTPKEVSYKQLIDDFELMDMAVGSINVYKYKINNDNDLKELADYIVDKKLEDGEFAYYSSVRFDPSMFNLIGGTNPGGIIGISNDIKETYRLYETLTHEIEHASGSNDESATVIKAMNTMASIASKGDRRFERALFNHLRHVTAGALKMKVIQEGVPEEYKDEVEDILQMKLVKEGSRYEVDYSGDPTDFMVPMRTLREYALIPYLKVRSAIGRKGKRVKTEDGFVNVEPIVDQVGWVFNYEEN